MIQFLDYYGNQVELSFSKEEFLEEPQHVIVICQYGEEWLLTNHKQRGLEFPGGKREAGETAEEAARREVYEETGAILGELTFLAMYRVSDEQGSFVKAVYRGNVERLEETNSYYETGGPSIVSGDLLNKRFGEEYSFIMKDRVIEEVMEHMEKE